MNIKYVRFERYFAFRIETLNSIKYAGYDLTCRVAAFIP